MKIVFFGSSEFSIPILKSLLSSKHSLVHIMTTPDKKKGRGQKIQASVVKTFALEHRLAVSAPEKLSVPAVPERFKKLTPDLMVIASYGKMVPASMFAIPKIASLNVHPSLLPRYRGASPVQSAILEGDKKTGVSIAEVTDELDAGDLFAQVETEIDENENALELSRRLAQIGASLVLETIDQLQAGKILKIQQDTSRATYAKKLDKDCGRIDWVKPAFFIHNQVRAYYPWPSAFTFFRGKRLKILETRQTETTPDRMKPGTITDIGQNEFIYVQTESCPIALVRLQPEGRREMTAFEFALGQRIQKGDRFE